MSPLNDGSLDLPYEPQDETLLTDHFAVCGGVVTMAAVLDVEGTPQPALVFRFALADGSGFLSPVLLCVTDMQMHEMGKHISSAIRDAVRSARASGEIPE